MLSMPLMALAETKYKIVCTVGMITDVVSNIVGDRAEVKGMMGPGIDPHLYKATRSDIALLNSADVVFYNGLLLEGKMTDALIRVATAGKKVFAVSETLDQQFLLEPAEFNGLFDPHVWMDPVAWTKVAENIETKLSEYDPEGAATYKKNVAQYLDTLNKLNSYATKGLASVPKESRMLVTAHDAFNYFGRRYNFEVVGIQGLSTDSEAGVRDIERIVELLVNRKVKAVFVESTVSPRNIKALIEGAAARGHEVKIGGQLFSDAMGKAGTYEGTYVGMIDHNVTTIVSALGGSVPTAGMQGKLTKVE